MTIYDLIHGHQPFDPLVSTPKWIKKNLKEKFLPTSLAMRNGLIPRGVQLQGWTIDAWLKAKKPIKDLARKTLKNLRIASQRKNVEIGVSAYAHPILPMLSDDLIRTQVILDKEVVEKYLGRPTWFWPPEGAIDKRVLKIIHQLYPDLILLIPDKAIGRHNFSGPLKIKFSARSGKKDFQKAIAFSCLFKDLFMNAEDYRKRPKYLRRPRCLPKELVWARVRRAVHSPKIFLQVLEYLRSSSLVFNQKNFGEELVLMRDWENAGSKKGLRKIKGAANVQGQSSKDIGVFLRFKNQNLVQAGSDKKQINFCLPSRFNWKKAKIISIDKITPCSWDMESNPQDPFPWWRPSKRGKIWRRHKLFRRKKIMQWQESVKEFDRVFQQKLKGQGGLDLALKNREFKELLKRTLPAVHSCVGWHYFAKRAWKPDYQYSQQAIKNIVLPGLDLLTKF